MNALLAERETAKRSVQADFGGAGTMQVILAAQCLVQLDGVPAMVDTTDPDPQDGGTDEVERLSHRSSAIAEDDEKLLVYGLENPSGRG